MAVHVDLATELESAVPDTVAGCSQRAESGNGPLAAPGPDQQVIGPLAFRSLTRVRRSETMPLPGRKFAVVKAGVLVEAEGPRFPDAGAVIAAAYADKKFDEFVVPAVIGDYKGMRDDDGVLGGGCFQQHTQLRRLCQRDGHHEAAVGRSESGTGMPLRMPRKRRSGSPTCMPV